MKLADTKIAGTLLFVGAVQFIVFGLITAEAGYEGYSTSGNYISDLGVGPAALIFNLSVFLLGILIVASAYFIQREFGSKLLFVFLVLAGIGAMGVGLFPETAGEIHRVVSLITFLFGGLSGIASYKVEKPPFSCLSIMLGAAGLVALVLFGLGIYLGIDHGGMERMIAYPILLWGVGFSSHLIAYSKEAESASKT